jgi:prolyl oligopeptidase
MKRRRLWGLTLGLIAGAAWVGAARAEPPAYPPTRIETAVDVVHGVSIEDPYRWLEDGESAEVQEWTRAQNAFTRKYLDQFPELRARLTQRLTELFRAAEFSSPRVRGQRLFYTKREGDQNHAVVYVKDSPDVAGRIVLNPNEFSPDGTTALDWWFPSPDGGLIAYGKSSNGDEKSTLYVRDVTTGKDSEQSIPYTRSCTVAWDADGEGFHYTRLPAPGTVAAGDENYFRHIFHHKLGTDWATDPKLFGEGRPKEEWTQLASSGDSRCAFLTAGRGWSDQDLYVRRPGDAEFQPVAVGLKALYRADALGDRMYILTNYQAPRYRIVAAGLDDLRPEAWREIVPQQKGILQGMEIVGGKLVVNVLENAYSRLCVYEPDGKPAGEIELPTLGSVAGVNGRQDDNDLYFRFESFTYPPTVFRYDLGTHQMTVMERTAADWQVDDYVSKQVWFNSKDGTRVPMFVIHKKDLALNGDNPTVLYGYGGFNVNATPAFLQQPLPFLEAGGVYAVANLRGGGEFGEEWHRAGQLESKQNVFDDMIAACEKLIADGYTQPRRLGVRGGSNGGLLVGALITQRPDLFQAAYCAVPLLDMVRYHRFRIARLWIPEYGSAEDAGQFKYLYAYSPYHHVQTGAKYPGVMFTTAESDSRVDPMHARKMAALLQAASGSDNPILLWTEQKAGHGVGKPLHMRIADYVDQWTFFEWQLGLNDQECRIKNSE